MRALFVVLALKRVESELLSSHVRRGWARRLLLQRQMESLVAAVLLRLSGLDALERDVDLDDLHCEPGQAEMALRSCPRLTIVHADRRGHPVLAEDSRQRRPDIGRHRVAHRRARLAAKKISAECVGDGERIAPSPVAESKPAFEVHTP